MKIFLKQTLALLVAASLTPVGALASTLEGDVAEVGNRFDLTMKQTPPAAAGAPAKRSAGSSRINKAGPLFSAAVKKSGRLPAPPPPGGGPDAPRGLWSSILHGIAAAARGVGIATREIVGTAVGVAVGVALGSLGVVWAASIIGPTIIGPAALLAEEAEGEHHGWYTVSDGPFSDRGYRKIVVDHFKGPVTWTIGGFCEGRRLAMKAMTLGRDDVPPDSCVPAHRR